MQLGLSGQVIPFREMNRSFIGKEQRKRKDQGLLWEVY